MKIPYKYAVALTAALGLFMAVLDSTIVNVALVAMERDFQTTINGVQWIVTGYLLAQAAAIPVTGYLGNRFGIKRVFTFALIVFTLGSLLCGLSPRIATGATGLQLLIFFRVLQGIGGGMLFPLGSAIAFAAFPPEERAASSAVVGIPILFAPALGPTIGGLIVDSGIKWPGIFFINVPVGIITLFLVARVIRPDEKEAAPGGAPRRFDYGGLFLSIVGVILVVYAFVLVSRPKSGSVTTQNPNGTINGWGYWLVWALLGAGMFVLLIFSLLELRVIKDPVLDLRLFTNRHFTIATVATWLARALVFGSFLLVPLFLQQFRGDSAVRTGLILMAQGIGAMIGITSGSRLYDIIGPRYLTFVGMLLLVVATVWLVRISPDSDARFFVPVLFVRGIAFGWGSLPLQTVALAAITGPALPKASSLYNASAQIFTSIGTAVTTTLLVQRTTTHATALVASAVAGGSRPPANLVLLAGTGAMKDVFLYLTFGSALVTLICLFLPRQSIKQQMAGMNARPAPASMPQEPFAAAPEFAETVSVSRPAAAAHTTAWNAPAMPAAAPPTSQWEPMPQQQSGPYAAPQWNGRTDMADDNRRVPQSTPPWNPSPVRAPGNGVPWESPEPVVGQSVAPVDPVAAAPPPAPPVPIPIAPAPETIRDSDGAAHDALVTALERFVRSEATATQEAQERRIAALEAHVARLTEMVQQQSAVGPSAPAMDEERIAALETMVGHLDRFARALPPTRWYQIHDLRGTTQEQRIAAIERAMQQLAWSDAPPLPDGYGHTADGAYGSPYGNNQPQMPPATPGAPRPHE